MTVMTEISDSAHTARENARTAAGEFGEQTHSAPELSLALPKTDVIEWDGTAEQLDGLRGSEKVRIVCGKCHGTGLYTAPSSVTLYTATVGAVTTGCFDCAGTGHNDYLVSSMRARLRREEKAAEAAAAADAAAKSSREAWVAAGHDVLLREVDDVIQTLDYRDKHREALNEAYDRMNRFTATEEDAQFARAAIQAVHDYRNKPSTVPDGIADVEGVILTLKWQDGFYGPGSGSLKMLVDLGDARVWGTSPTSLIDAGIGDTVRFTATFQRSEDDPEFGFFKRPKKASVVAKAEPA